MVTLEEFSDRLHQHVLSSAWDQWAALGVAAAAPRALGNGIVVDPEALLVTTLAAARRDPRLFDEVADWLLLNGDMLNVVRLRRLLSRHGMAPLQRIYLALSEALSRQGSSAPRWASPRTDDEHDPSGGGIILFRDARGRPLPVPRNPDPAFLRHGLLRENLAPRGLSRPIPNVGVSSMLLQLRALIGTTSRCELLCLLATREGLVPTEMSALTGYALRTVQEALAEMARGPHVHAVSLGRENSYSLARTGIRQIVPPEGARLLPSVPGALLVANLLTKAEELRERRAKDGAAVALLRSTLKESMTQLGRHGLPADIAICIDAPASDFHDQLLNALVSTLPQLAA